MRRENQPLVTVLGAGVMGCSIALALRSAGFAVRMRAQQQMSDPGATRDPCFASVYPVASVIPRSIPGEGVGGLLAESMAIFDELLTVLPAGVRRQRHFEVHERPFTPPDYARQFHDFAPLEEYRRAPPPQRKDTPIYGYTFQCLFADMERYAPWLESETARREIPIERSMLTPDNIPQSDFIINCLGAGAARVFPALGPGFFYRGILLHVPHRTAPGNWASYNYTPLPSVYVNADGGEADLYFYPRDGHAVLGGTRQRGSIDPVSGAFVPDVPYAGETVEIAGIAVPLPVWEVNRALVENFAGARLTGPVTPKIGYRHAHGTKAAPEMVVDWRDGSSQSGIIDCLGFGGAGVTLSWGVALRVAELLAAETGRDPLTPAALATGLRAH